MIKRILLPLDASDYSKKALELAKVCTKRKYDKRETPQKCETELEIRRSFKRWESSKENSERKTRILVQNRKKGKNFQILFGNVKFLLY